jgi:hypothetical protein
MAGRKRRAVAADVSRAVQRFEQWRQTRGRRELIPARLWSLAADVAGRHGVSRKAGALRLACYALKERLTKPQPRSGAAGCFRWWPRDTGPRAAFLVAHQLQVLLSAGDPSATKAGPAWRSVSG